MPRNATWTDFSKVAFMHEFAKRYDFLLPFLTPIANAMNVTETQVMVAVHIGTKYMDKAYEWFVGPQLMPIARGTGAASHSVSMQQWNYDPHSDPESLKKFMMLAFIAFIALLMIHGITKKSYRIIRDATSLPNFIQHTLRPTPAPAPAQAPVEPPVQTETKPSRSRRSRSQSRKRERRAPSAPRTPRTGRNLRPTTMAQRKNYTNM